MKDGMKRIHAWATLGACAVATTGLADERPMNVIMIMADDLGWSDVTLYGTTTLYETPNLERLAARGMTFTRAYTASPLCSPTRASIMTGQTCVRSGHTAPQHHIGQPRLQASVAASAPPGNKALQCETANRLDPAIPTLGQQLRKAGVRTGHFGKWHLGPAPFSPLQHGFEVDIPNWHGPGPRDNFVAPWSYPSGLRPSTPDEHIEDRMAAEAVNWMRTVADEPFYLQFWQFSVHAPFDAKPELIDYYRPKIDLDSPQRSPTYAAMVHSLDDAVGTLLDEVDRLGIADRTIFIYYSDNGGNMYNGIPELDMNGNEYIAQPTSNAPLRGGKATMFEGGVRVPCVVVWPGVTEPGSRSDRIIQSTDWYTTILAMMNVPLPEGHAVDGVDITPALKGKEFNRGPMFNYFPHSPPVPDWLPPSVSVHLDDWKLIRLFHQGENQQHDYLLYNLAEDIGERNNLAAAMPEKVRSLDALIEAHIQDANAVVPLPNPRFNPAQYRPEAVGVQPGGLKLGRSRDERVAGALKSLGEEEAGPAIPEFKGEPQAGGWSAGRDTVGLRIEEGALVVCSIAVDPWIQIYLDRPLEGRAPLTLRFEVYTDGPGAMRVYDSNRTARGFRPSEMVNVAVPRDKTWVEVRTELKSGTPLTGLRINPPNRPGETGLRNIRVEDASGRVLQKWF